MSGTHTDIHAEKLAAEQIEQLAFYDPLTQLPNRRLLLDRLRQALVGSARHGRHGALLLLDLDNFQLLNDALGHEVGDQLLQRVAERLKHCIRRGDTVARLGGDEFVILLDDLDETELAVLQVERIVSKVRSELGRPFALQLGDGALPERRHQCSTSLGIALFQGDGVSAEELLKRADTALYQAKAAGRDAWRFFDPHMQSMVAARADLEEALRQGLQEEQFQLHYQGQVDAEGYPTGAEVLLRWQHPQRGMVSPAEFIPLAEETGLIVPLGAWVLQRACAQLVAWAARPQTAALCIAVNVSARQFNAPGFVDQLLALLDSSGAPPQRLKLELTESMMVANAEEVIARMTQLKARGVRFSLDDFGTGYSSLSYLKRMPFDQLKIDQSFVRDVLSDPNDAAIARTIVALGQSLGLEVIAEGVESSAQRDLLQVLGCRHYQGYLYHRPLPLEVFERWLDEQPHALH
jgi:diguanylate cyclase (GGDEF)-like protein